MSEIAACSSGLATGTGSRHNDSAIEAPAEERMMQTTLSDVATNPWGSRAASTAPEMLTRDFLAWVAREPRSYADAMEAWRSSCPRFTIWEDAIANDLIRFVRAGTATFDQTGIELTPRGRALLDRG